MASKISIRYTDEEYLARRGLSKAMNTSMVDSFWRDILDYRREYRKDLGMFTFNKTPMYFTLTPAIEAKIKEFESKMNSYLRLYRGVDEREKFEIRKISFFPLLKSICLYEGATNMSDMSLRALLNGTYRENNIDHAPVLRYFHTLSHYLDDNNQAIPPSDEFLGDAYTYLLGVAELYKFYREEGPNQYRPTSVLGGYDYDKAPVKDIEVMMDRLYACMDKDIGVFVRAMISLFEISYIQPFDSLNHPLAILFAKNVVANGPAGNSAFVLPFETLLSDRLVMESIKDTKNEGDLTYFILACLNNLSKTIDNLSDQAQKARVSVYKPEYQTLSREEEERAKEIAPAPYQAPAPEPAPIKEEPKVEEPLPFEDFFYEEPTKEIKPEPAPEPIPEPTPIEIEEEVEEEIEFPEIEEKPEPKNALKPSRIITPEEMKESQASGGRLFEVPGNILSDKEVKEYVRYLLETNPNLNKKQASFLANHCTPGRFYTIQQYKSFCRCAYETARTSMDHLTNEGYYEKLQVKNKFVYRPANKGE